MADYISRDDILDIASQYCPDDDGSCSKADVDLREMLDEIEALPASDVQPVKHGQWKYIGITKVSAIKICECNQCHKKTYGSLDYCGNCGARMDGEQNDNS